MAFGWIGSTMALGEVVRNPKNKVRAGDRLGLGAAVALEPGPDAGKGRQRATVIQGKPDYILFLCFGVGLRRLLSEAIKRHQTALFRLQPAAPVRRRRVCGCW
jgi:hypothetical protein